ncbi:MAG: hypothetical protein ACP5JJ_00580, partial [Anaerolineae bacterium]
MDPYSRTSDSDQITPPPTQPAPPRLPIVWILVGIVAVLILVIGGLLVMILTGDSRGETPSPTPTEAVAAATETPVEAEATASPEPPATTTTEPSATPTAEPTSTSAPPTDTPLPSTDTPSPTPTQTFTPTPTPTPTTPPPPTCAFDAHGTFADLWNTYKEQLGCPVYAEPKPIQDAEQAFEHGRMLWRQDIGRIYVLYEDGPKAGTYQAFADPWSEGDPEYSCSATPPPGLIQPIRGFGAVWCDLGGATAPIGWALVEELGFWPGNGDPLVQDFEHGVIFR